jgi:hypothetical protein
LLLDKDILAALLLSGDDVDKIVVQHIDSLEIKRERLSSVY